MHGDVSWGGDGCAGAEGQSVRVVCVPSFSRTGVLVAVNLRTLEARPIHVKGPDAA